jgi:hypothetical protein
MTRVVIGLIALAVIMIAIPLLLGWSASRRRPRLGRPGGVAVLRMPRGHNAILAAIAVLPCAAFAITALVVAWAPGARWNGWVLAGFMGSLGVALGGYLLALEVRQRIRVDGAAIEKFGAFTHRRYPWADVAQVTFNPVNKWFFFTTRDGQRVYVAEALEGIADFADLALLHLPPPVLAGNPDAAEALRDIAAGH